MFLKILNYTKVLTDNREDRQLAYLLFSYFLFIFLLSTRDIPML